MGIEPTSSAWEAEVLPLNYTRMSKAPLLPSGEKRAAFVYAAYTANAGAGDVPGIRR